MDIETKQTVLVVGQATKHALIVAALKERPEIRIIQVDNGEEAPLFEEIESKLLSQVDLVVLEKNEEENPDGDLRAYTLDDELKHQPMPEHEYKLSRGYEGPSRGRTGRTGERRQFAEAGPKQPGRNTPCPCGSGKKFKKCCIGK